MEPVLLELPAESQEMGISAHDPELDDVPQSPATTVRPSSSTQQLARAPSALARLASSESSPPDDQAVPAESVLVASPACVCCDCALFSASPASAPAAKSRIARSVSSTKIP